VLPQVAEKDAFWARKQRAEPDQPARGREYQPIELPKNSAIGFITAFFAVISGFALIWHIWWLACAAVLGAFVATLFFAFRDKDEIEIPLEQLVRFDRAHSAGVAL
jgi:cytochrome o ubiquinol oxidase subunit 1